MESPRGRVIDVAKGLPFARVEVTAALSCARCESGKGCGAGLLGGKGGNRCIEAQIPEGIAVQEGDEVHIELAPRNLLQAALIVYGLPLGGALVGAGVAYAAGLGDLYAALAGLGGIAAGVLIANMRLRNSRRYCEFTPTIVEKLARVS